jgi:hypothetical protein
MSKEPRPAVSAQAVVARLVEAAGMDTVYRDLYLQRARALLAQCLPNDEYLRLKGARARIDQTLRQSRAAVARGDWIRVKELASSVAGLQRGLADRQTDLDLAAAVYGPQQVPIDPFSPGFESLLAARGLDLLALRDRVGRALAALQRDDPEWAAFYDRRRSHFARLAVRAETVRAAADAFDPVAIQREALRAAERGEAGRLLSLAKVMLEPHRAPAVTTSAQNPGAAFLPAPTHVSVPFTPESIARAQRFGLAAVTLKSYERISAFVGRHAWHSSFADEHVMQDGASTAAVAADDLQLRPGVPARLREVLALFAIHPYINSAGVRYLPWLATEHVLVEDFEEATELPGSSPLLAGLGLSRRRALSRLEIETALLQRGPTVLQHELALDSREFRLVCIPFDIYARAGLERGWGRRPLWTHFDGYQLLRDGSVLALVGGDTRYGGLYDLCSISRTDQREGVIARFAVVRRDRLLAGWH